MSGLISVVGNCQCRGIVEALSKVAPGPVYTAIPLQIIRTREQIEQAKKTLLNSDFVFAQGIQRALALVEATNAKTFLFPPIGFNGFHPDFSDMTKLGPQFRSATSFRHSLIVAAAFTLGIDGQQVHSLFDTALFERLGYFEEYDKGKRFLFALAKKASYDIKDDLSEWLRSGVFMHTPNHPKVVVLKSIAVRLAQAAGLACNESGNEPIGDELERKGTLPVFPAIAEKLGLLGGLMFKWKTPTSDAEVFDMDEYIARTYKLYNSVPRTLFNHEDIQRVAAVIAKE